jgi:hypothetical protein
MRLKIAIPVIAALAALWGCSKAPAPAPAAQQQATVTLKDGSTFSGSVTGNSTDSISLQAATGEARTYPMSQVASVQYGPAPAPTTQVAAAPQPASPAPQPAEPAPAPQPASSAPAPVSEPLPAPPIQTAAPAPAPTPVPPPAPAPPPAPVVIVRTIPVGTTISVRNNDTIDSTTAQVGQTYSAVVVGDVHDSNGHVVIPAGASATLTVRSATDQGKAQGQSDLAVDVSSVRIRGHQYRLDTSDVAEKGKQGVGTNKRTAKFTGGGAVFGTIIGAIAGGGKGAAIGAAAGAGAGLATQAATRGKAVKIPPETVMNFQLQSPVTVREVK